MRHSGSGIAAPINALTNNTGGKISGGEAGIANDGGITTLSNSGSITGGTIGLYNAGSITTLDNSGAVTGTVADAGTVGLGNSGNIETLNNNEGGNISGGAYGLVNTSSGTIAALNNAADGTISGGATGIANGGGITALSNNGTITATSGDGILNAGTIGTLTNNAGGSISGGGDGIVNDGTINEVINNGSVSSLVNNDEITGGAIGVNNSGTIGTLINNADGMISGTTYAIQSTGGGLGEIVNNGEISGNIAVTGQKLTIGGSGGELIDGTLSVGGVSESVRNLPAGGEGTVDFDGGDQFSDDTIDANVDVTQGMLTETGTIDGTLTVAPSATLLMDGTVSGNVTVNGGSTYEVNITGEANGTYDYSTLHVTGDNTFTIQPGATLAPIVAGTDFVPGLGAPEVTLVTADGGVDGTFSNMTSPGVGTQYVLTYDADDVYLAIVPSAQQSPFRAYALMTNANAAANVLDQILLRYPTDPAASTLTGAQTQLIDYATSLPAGQMQPFLTALNGQIHAAMMAVAPQDGQEMEGSIYDHLASTAGDLTAHRGVWGNISTQFGERGTDSVADGFTSQVTQEIVGADLLTRGAARLGIGFASSSNSVNEGNQSGTAQEYAGFVYGQVPVHGFEVQGIGSYGSMSTDTQRADPLGGAMLKANGVGANDALVSLGVSRPFLVHRMTLAPYAHVTWQQVAQGSFSEGTASAAGLSVDSFTGTGVRSTVGIRGGSAVSDPLAAPVTFQFNLGVGADAGNLLNPNLNGTLAGIGMSIAAPHVSAAFGQGSVGGTLRVSHRAYVYGQLSGEVHSNATIAGISGGLRMTF